MKRWWMVALLLNVSVGVASAQGPGLRVGARFVAAEANSPPGTCGCFWLQGAGVDAAVPVWRGLSLDVDLAGVTTKRVPSTARGLSVITLLGGPRYSLRVQRHVTVQAQALFGVARGFDADFVVSSTTRTDTANVFGMALGGAVEVPVSRNFAVRAVQVDYLASRLPNGVDDRQHNVRVGTGVVWRVRLPERR